MKFHGAAAALTLVGLLRQGLGKLDDDDNNLMSPESILKQNLHGQLRTFDDPFGAVYEPIGSDAENGHEAKLVVPSRVAEKMFSQGGPFMECEYGVFPDAAGEMVVTLKGGRRAVEYCRAEMRDMAVAVGVKRVKMMPWRDRTSETEKLTVPEDMLTALRADGGKRIDEWERLTGAKIQISEEPDSADPTARTVLISAGGKMSGDWAAHELMDAIRAAAAAELDRITPGVWRLVSIFIKPERAGFIIGENGSIMKELADLTGCRVQFSSMILESYPAKQAVYITGPGDGPREAVREIRTLIAEAESRMSPEALGYLPPAEYYGEVGYSPEVFKDAEHIIE